MAEDYYPVGFPNFPMPPSESVAEAISRLEAGIRNRDEAINSLVEENRRLVAENRRFRDLGGAE